MLPLLLDVASRFADLFYPSTCSVCNELCDSVRRLCPACDSQLIELETAAACERCAMPLARPKSPCPWCKGKGRPPFDQIARLGIYDEPLRILIHHMKYHRRWAVGEMLADRLLASESAKSLMATADCLLPVPLHFRRQFGRGYNQSQVLARRIGKQCHVPVVRGVIRIRNTKTQTEIRSQKDRHDNVRGAFTLVNSNVVAGKHVVVVDDVMTSGATLQAVGRALLEAKPASISALVLAVADPKGRHFEMI